MTFQDINRFQQFFAEDKYILLKNYLYNYLLRKKAVEKNLCGEVIELALEVGSGISPVMTRTNRIVYSDLSFSALKILKGIQINGWYVVADAMNLPFKSSMFSHTICSEVLEHLKDDHRALIELCRVMRKSSRLIVTFPHRKFYFGNDDRFVNHFRRYEIYEIEERLLSAGLEPLDVQKVLGPLEKVMMSFVIYSFSFLQTFKKKKGKNAQPYKKYRIFASLFKWANRFVMGLAWIDARIIPRIFSSTILIKAQKKP